MSSNSNSKPQKRLKSGAPPSPNVPRPSECSLCAAYRKRRAETEPGWQPQGTFIYSTKGIVRYVKCRDCGHTWTMTHRKPDAIT